MSTSVAEQLHVDPARPDTFAQQIREQLTWLVSSGVLIPGDELPPARSLAASLGVNFHTVRAAYRRLENDGLAETRRGRRTRVAHFDPQRLWPRDRAARTHLVGVVLPSLSNPFYAELLEGAQDAARASDTLLVVATTHDDQALALRAIAQLAAKGADGVVVVAHDISTLVEQAEGPDSRPVLPLVAVDRPGSRGNAVEIDLEGAGHLAATHLLGHGHRRIGLITNETRASNVLPVEDGFRRALAEAGEAHDQRLTAIAGGWDVEAGAAAGARLLEGQVRPTAVVAIADLLAIGAMGSFRQAGVRVPSEIAVVGIDDISVAALTDPPLTTVSLPARSMGAEALAALEHARNRPGLPPRRVKLEVHLTIRESCGLHTP